MEEALGDCANIHMMYPGFVFGFLHFIRYATPGLVLAADASFSSDGQPLPKLIRYHDVLVSLSGRTTITDPAMRCESVGLVVYKCENGAVSLVDTYPPENSPVHYRGFYERLYRIYDLRYAYPDSSGKNSRKVWSPRGIQFPGDFDADLGFPWAPRFGDDLEQV